jgi:LCP family protein required for cell wall assembly
MSFFKKKQTNKTQGITNKAKRKMTKGWKIGLLIIMVLGIVGVSFVSYVVSSGSKVFENGIGNSAELIKTIKGENVQLKGEDTDRINILLMGMGGINHPGGMLTDSIMVLSIKPSTKQMALISVPRDLYVSIKGTGDAKINSALSLEYNRYLAKECGKKPENFCKSKAVLSGANFEAETVGTVLDIPINYYILADFSAFEKLIDQLGGVDVYVDRAISDPLFPDAQMKGYSPFKISVGQQHLDGATALKYARSRETTSDFDRAARQQKVFQAVKDKALQSGVLANPKKIMDIVGTLGESVRTNLSPAELKELAITLKEVPKDSVNTKVFTNSVGGELEDFNNGVYYLKPKGGSYAKIQAIVENIFNSEYQSRETATVAIYYNAKGYTAANNLSKDLRDKYSYEIFSIAQSKTAITATTVTDYSGGNKPKTIKFLSELLKSATETKTRGKGTTPDITISLGPDYIPVTK